MGTANSKNLGEKCTMGIECIGNNLGTGPGTQCCEGKCTQKTQDYTGGYWCPKEAITIFLRGSRNIGESCYDVSNCKDASQDINTPGTFCCEGTCTQKLKDWAGKYYCPNECRDAPWPYGKPGSCNSGLNWPRTEGQPCKYDRHCRGATPNQRVQLPALKCCSGVCREHCGPIRQAF